MKKRWFFFLFTICCQTDSVSNFGLSNKEIINHSPYTLEKVPYFSILKIESNGSILRIEALNSPKDHEELKKGKLIPKKDIEILEIDNDHDTLIVKEDYDLSTIKQIERDETGQDRALLFKKGKCDLAAKN